MTTDFHLLGDRDERLVARAKDYIWSKTHDGSVPDMGALTMVEELVERVYLLHEREEELAREKENADNLQAINDQLRDELCNAAAEIMGIIDSGRPGKDGTSIEGIVKRMKELL